MYDVMNILWKTVELKYKDSAFHFKTWIQHDGNKCSLRKILEEFLIAHYGILF